MKEPITVLFIPRWYPNRTDPMAGLYIQQLAESLIPDCEVAVLSVHPDNNCSSHREIEISGENGVHVVRIYYRVPRLKILLPAGLMKMISFLSAYREGLRVTRNFVPDLLHVHVLTRHGMIAWINKLYHKVPYVVSEHWSRYFPENGTFKGSGRKMLTKLVAKDAAGLIAVSEKLKEAMTVHGLNNSNFQVIPNSVDFERFVPAEGAEKQTRKKIVHVSCFEDKSKNISALLRVMARLAEVRNDFTCSLIGEGPDLEKMKIYARELNLDEKIVRFEGLQTGDMLVSSLNTADFMVLSSRYETFATVVVESLACGVPVVATAVGIAPEIINRSNGILVPPSDEEALFQAIQEMLDKCRDYDKTSIRSGVITTFDRKIIARQVKDFYTGVIKSSRIPHPASRNQQHV